jgi:hypothetical protein
MTDFGADASFAEAAKKMKEHYGIEVPPCMIEKTTLDHAEKIGELGPQERELVAKVLVAEMDGGMVPIVEMDMREEGRKEDRRKTRRVCWKEAKLCFVRGHQEVSRIYGAIIGTPEQAGEKLQRCAKRVGFGEETYVHALGDGAPWIVEEIGNQFGARGHFLIDFFHMSEYLSQAAIWCDPLNPAGWLEERKQMMKEASPQVVLSELEARREYLKDLPEVNSLDKCINYMEKRIVYMNYFEARQKGLPIGSGEIESSHRHVVQRRLKLAGAWWREDRANLMLQLRTARANNDWESYWKDFQKSA